MMEEFFKTLFIIGIFEIGYGLIGILLKSEPTSNESFVFIGLSLIIITLILTGVYSILKDKDALEDKQVQEEKR